MRRWSATRFALDAGSLILTLVPFALMSYAFDRDLLARFGVVPFTLAYVLLLRLSTVLLLAVRLFHLATIRPGAPQTRAAANQLGRLTEGARYGALAAFWFMLNGTAVFLIVVAFRLLGGADACRMTWDDEAPFLLAFAAIAATRTLLDSTHVWPFLYCNHLEVRLPELLPLMRWIAGHELERGFTFADALGMALLLLALVSGGPMLWHAFDGSGVLAACESSTTP